MKAEGNNSQTSHNRSFHSFMLGSSKLKLSIIVQCCFLRTSKSSSLCQFLKTLILLNYVKTSMLNEFLFQSLKLENYKFSIDHSEHSEVCIHNIKLYSHIQVLKICQSFTYSVILKHLCFLMSSRHILYPKL